MNVGLQQIGKTVFHPVNTNNTNSKKIVKEKGEAARSDMLAKVAKASGIRVLGKVPASLTIEQLNILLALLRHHKNKKMTTKKGDIVLCLVGWDSRGSLSFDEEVDIVVANTRSYFQQRENNEIDEEEYPLLPSEEV